MTLGNIEILCLKSCEYLDKESTPLQNIELGANALNLVVQVYKCAFLCAAKLVPLLTQ